MSSPTHISDSTWVSLKTFLPTLAAILAAALWITSQQAETRAEFKDGLAEVRADARVAAVQQAAVANDVIELKVDVANMRHEVSNNKWTKSEMAEWARRLKTLNPNVITVPEIE